MRIGVLRYPVRTTDGLAHYEMVFLDALAEAAAGSGEEFACLVGPENDFFSLVTQGGLNYRGLPIRPLRDTVFRQEAPEFYLVPPQAGPELDPNSIPFDKESASAYRKAGIDLVLQLGPYAYPFLSRVPFVMPIFDLNHRLQPEFRRSARSANTIGGVLYINTCRFATFVLVDSEAGKADVLRFYGDQIGEDRIRILPYYPAIGKKPLPDQAEQARVAAKYRLPKRYFFYPAQFWRHKNHAAILHALRIIADETGERVRWCSAALTPTTSRAQFHRAEEARQSARDRRARVLSRHGPRRGHGGALHAFGGVGDADVLRPDQFAAARGVALRPSRHHVRYQRRARTDWRRRAIGRSEIAAPARAHHARALEKRRSGRDACGAWQKAARNL
jgi:hypothetical protein